MTKDTGGQAFPTYSIVDGLSGMTLRDWFAGQALNGILSGQLVIGIPKDEPRPQFLALCAYDMADAMIAERSKP